MIFKDDVLYSHSSVDDNKLSTSTMSKTNVRNYSLQLEKKSLQIIGEYKGGKYLVYKYKN